MLLASLSEAGVGVEDVQRVERPTGSAMILITPDGENSIVVSPGANAELDVDFADNLRELWTSAGLVVMNFECPPPTIAHVARTASQQGVRVMINAAPALEMDADLLASCDPLVVNETEALIVTGRSPEDDVDAEAIARELADRGARSVVVTLGSKGCVVLEDGTAEHVPAYRVDAVDTTGAGDAFVGALAAELSTGATLRDAAKFATATSAVSVQSMGAQASYRPRAVIEDFIASNQS